MDWKQQNFIDSLEQVARAHETNAREVREFAALVKEECEKGSDLTGTMLGENTTRIVLGSFGNTSDLSTAAMAIDQAHALTKGRNAR